MYKIKNPNQRDIFDPWDFLTPKRRQLLEDGWPGLFREHILPSIPVDKLAKYFDATCGRPTKELYAMVGALILQQTLDLTDDETVRQYSLDTQWHFALNITEESDNAKYMSHKTLWNNRNIVSSNHLEEEIFKAGTDKLAEVFKVNTDKQRIDSVHIKSNMRRLGRIGIFSRSIHKFLVNLKRSHPDQFATVDKKLVEKYLSKTALGCFSRVKPSESKKTLTGVSKDLFNLVEQFKQCDEVTLMYSYKLLERVLREQCHLTDDKDHPVELKTPKELQADSLYGSDDNCEKAAQHDVELVAPTMGSVNKDKLSLADFQFSPKGEIVACPQGHAPAKVRKRKKTSIGFDATHCRNCPDLQRCPVKEGKKYYYLRFTDKEMRITKRRLHEQSEEFKDRYRWRAGVEATMSEYDRRTGVKQLRVKGRKAVRFCATLKALGINIFRAAALRTAQMMEKERLCEA